MPASTRTAVAIASGMLVLGAGVGVATTASADPIPTPNPTSVPSIPTPGIPTPNTPLPSSPPPGTEEPPDWPTSPEQEAQEAVLIKALSEMLGVDEAQVKAALDQLRAAYAAQGPAALDGYLDQAVQAGILTPEEADAIRQMVEQGMVNPGPR